MPSPSSKDPAGLPSHPLTWANRVETSFELQTLEGQIPDDLSGHVFLNSPCGTVNSEGTPLPKKNPDGSRNTEWGEMLFNGDALLFRFDMDQPGRVGVKTSLLRTPDYWVDEAARWGTPGYQQGWGFQGMGIARTNMKLGSRNQLNTSVAFFREKTSSQVRLAATFDAGRPFEVDPVTMQVVRPLGGNDEWRGTMPSFLQQLFPLHQATAHPSFDPVTGELFTVNFRKSLANLVFGDLFHTEMVGRKGWLSKELHHLEGVLDGHKAAKGRPLNTQELATVFAHYGPWLRDKFETGHQESYALSLLEKGSGPVITGATDEVRLLRWTGAGRLDAWNLVDADTGENLVITQTMHQTGLSQNWIVLVDSSLKFALDIMINVPFPDAPWLNEALRRILARIQEPNTPLYLVRRADLVPGVAAVKAHRLTVNLETVHFAVEYDDSNDRLTLLTAHNAASCAAEWVRPYDRQAVNPWLRSPRDVIGVMASGEMDIGRMGKFVVDTRSKTFVHQEVVWSTGETAPNPPAQGNGHPAGGRPDLHTWAVALFTYRGYNDPWQLPQRIPSLFWQVYGLDSRLMTRFIEGLYRDYPHRLMPVDTIKRLARKGVPFCLVRQDTATQQLVDGWVFAKDENLRSLQFVPRRRGEGQAERPDLDGYILCTMVNRVPGLRRLYRREVWFFDAANLARGPICRLGHPDLSYAFTIHSSWVGRLDPAPVAPVYRPQDDYRPVLDSVEDEKLRAEFETVLKDWVYPHYASGRQ